MATTSPALQKGAEKYRDQRRRAGIARVVTFERWLRAGSKMRDIPTIPTNTDYKHARDAGKVPRHRTWSPR